MTEPKAESGQQPTADLDLSGRRLQDQAKWLVGIFGAIGAVIVAGSQLSSIGSLDSTEKVGVFGADLSRLQVALAGLAVALTGTAVAILRAIRVQTSAHVALDELAHYPKRRRHDKAPTWQIKRRVREVAEVLAAAYLDEAWPPASTAELTGQTPVDHLWSYWRDAGKRTYRLRSELQTLYIEQQTTALQQQYDLVGLEPAPTEWRIWDGLPTGVTLKAKPTTSAGPTAPPILSTFRFNSKLDDDKRTWDGVVERVAPAPAPIAAQPLTEAWSENLEASAGEVEIYQKVVAAVLTAASYTQVRLVFHRVARQLVVVAFVVAVGLGVFVWAANPPGGNATLVAAEPGTYAAIAVPIGMRDEIALLVGNTCDLTQPIRVKVLATSDTLALVQAQADQDGRCLEGEVFQAPTSTVS